MAYIVTLTSGELSSIRDRLRIEQRFTKARPKGYGLTGPVVGPPMVLVLEEDSESWPARHLAWLGVVAQHNTVGAVDKSLTVDPLRECLEQVPLDGEGGLLNRLSRELRGSFDRAAPVGGVGECPSAVWAAVDAALRHDHPRLTGLLDWLIAQASPPVLDSHDPADRAWQEQQDATRTAMRIAEFPPSALAAWLRPASRDAPYLAGLIPQPAASCMLTTCLPSAR